MPPGLQSECVVRVPLRRSYQGLRPSFYHPLSLVDAEANDGER